MPELKPPSAEEISRETILTALVEVADSGAAAKVKTLEDLNNFVIEKDVESIFGRAVSYLGHEDVWFGTLIKGASYGQDRQVSVNYQHAPALEGRRALHVHAQEASEPSFGLLLPFAADGGLDTSRTISASSFIEHGKVFSFVPERIMEETKKRHIEMGYAVDINPPDETEAAKIAQSIAFVTEMSAATLVSLLELEDVSQQQISSAASS
jgi:hypothetical protein